MSELHIPPASMIRARTAIPPRVPVTELDRMILGPRPAEGLARENDTRQWSFRLNTIRRRWLLGGIRR